MASARSEVASQTTARKTDVHKSTIPRLLYRGALSLPDSHLLLDGLTFTTQLPSDDPLASRTLLDTPLALALESMRGRPSLGFVGVVKLKDLHCDFDEGVSLHVHSRCILTKQLFTHNLCADPVKSSEGRTDLGVRIRLGDANTTGPCPNDVVVYGQAHPSASTMQLHVARIVPAPVAAAPTKPAPTAKSKPPRPDDPIPRKPPAGYVGIARIGLGMKRTASTASVGRMDEQNDKDGVEDEAAKKKAKKERDAPEVVQVLKARSKGEEGVFKVPSLPAGKAKPKATTSRAASSDVFDAPLDSSGEPLSELEAANKMFIKKTVVRLLTAAGVGKQHADFKEFYNIVYHGVMFALRAKLKSITIEADQKEVELLDRITQAHVTLYLGGQGLGIYLLQ